MTCRLRIPNFHLHARTVRVYENDHVVFRDVTFYIGDVPVFWWPYVYQSLNDAFNFTISPAYLSSWGPSILSQLTFPNHGQHPGQTSTGLSWTPRSRDRIRIGYRLRQRQFEQRQAEDLLPPGSEPVDQSDRSAAQVVPTGRYRLSLEDRTNFTDDIYGIVDVTKMSDPFVMQDFYQNEFRLNPVPDNVIAVTKSRSLLHSHRDHPVPGQ